MVKKYTNVYLFRKWPLVGLETLKMHWNSHLDLKTHCFPQKPSFLFDLRKKDMNFLDGVGNRKFLGNVKTEVN